MECQACRNYQPVVAKQAKPRVTVLTFDRDGKQGSYSFSGKPDWARIERETIGQGMMAVIVKNGKTSLEGAPSSWTHTALFSRHLPIGIETACRHASGMDAALETRWDYYHDEDLREAIAFIKSAITAWRERQPKPWAPQVGEKVWWDGVAITEQLYEYAKVEPGEYAIQHRLSHGWKSPYGVGNYWTTLDHLRPASEAPEHFDGEPCDLPVCGCSICQEFAPGLRFEHTGEYRDPAFGEWHLIFDTAKIGRRQEEYFTPDPRWILRAVPVEPPKPEWIVGDWAYDTKKGYPVCLGVMSGNDSVWVDSPSSLNGMEESYVADLRPLTPADWTREIGGVKIPVRAFGHDDGIGITVLSHKIKWRDIGLAAQLMREFCAAKNLPIMPFSLHQGKMDPPA